MYGGNFRMKFGLCSVSLIQLFLESFPIFRYATCQLHQLMLLKSTERQRSPFLITIIFIDIYVCRDLRWNKSWTQLLCNNWDKIGLNYLKIKIIFTLCKIFYVSNIYFNSVFIKIWKIRNFWKDLNFSSLQNLSTQSLTSS